MAQKRMAYERASEAATKGSVRKSVTRSPSKSLLLLSTTFVLTEQNEVLRPEGITRHQNISQPGGRDLIDEVA